MTVIRCRMCRKLSMSGAKMHGKETRMKLAEIGFDVKKVCRECVKEAAMKADLPVEILRIL